MSLFPRYRALWRELQAEGVFVHYNSTQIITQVTGNDLKGYFSHLGEDGNPAIALARDNHSGPCDEPSEKPCSDGRVPDIKDEFFTLAHEYGHFLSWSGEIPRPEWEESHQARLRFDDGANLSYGEKQLILDEETRAWSLGRRVIPGDLLAEYDLVARQGIHRYGDVMLGDLRYESVLRETLKKAGGIPENCVWGIRGPDEAGDTWVSQQPSSLFASQVGDPAIREWMSEPVPPGCVRVIIGEGPERRWRFWKLLEPQSVGLMLLVRVHHWCILPDRGTRFRRRAHRSAFLRGPLGVWIRSA